VTAELVDEDIQQERGAARRERDEVKRQRDEALRQMDNIGRAQSVHTLSAEDEDNIAAEAVKTRRKYMAAGCIATMVLVGAVVVLMVVVRGNDDGGKVAMPTTPSPSLSPTSAPTPQYVSDSKGQLLSMVDLYLDTFYNADTALEEDLEPIGSWDISRITDLAEVFSTYRNPLASLFNEDLSTWDTSSVTDMSNLFAGASLFNQDLFAWDVCMVSTMIGVFFEASSFDQKWSTWNTSGVTNMEGLFHNALAFNQEIST
jgi:surface protein